MYNYHNRKKLIWSIFLILLLAIGIGYAYLTSNLSISGQTEVVANTWDIHFENISIKEGSVTTSSPATIDSNKTTINYSIKLDRPGDFYEFTVDIKNDGTIDAMIKNVVSKLNGVEIVTLPSYLNYTVTYLDGINIEKNHRLDSGKKETYNVLIEYKKDISSTDFPTSNQNLDLSFSVEYGQQDDTSIPIRELICKKATELHSFFGTLGNEGSIVVGQAFDCDVNGDENYNSTNERFYYVSRYYNTTTKEFENDTAVLIFYSNVSAGEPSDATYTYENTNNNHIGPVAGMTQLPTRTQWINVSLKNEYRQLLTVDGGTITNVGATEYTLGVFHYENGTSRLLTAMEVNNACNSNLSSSACLFLFENTASYAASWNNGYWIENPVSANAYDVSAVNGNGRNLNGNYTSKTGQFGIRPVIEVPIDRIEY